MNTKKLLFLCIGALLTAWLCGTVQAADSLFGSTSSTYNGLLYETNGFWEQSSGIITINTTRLGRYSVRLQLGTARYSCSGAFDSNGKAANSISRRHDSSLYLSLQISKDDPDLITGRLSNGSWQASLYADRAVFNGSSRISPDAGKYTMIIPGDPTSSLTPGGDSYACVTVGKNGSIQASGLLADGTSFSQSSTISKNGQWPLYASLYSNWGALYSWMLFNGSNGQALSGDVVWIKPEMYWDWYYPRGFAISVSAWGSHYLPPAAHAKVLNLSSAAIEFNGGNLDHNFTNHVLLDEKNKVINQSFNSLRLSFSLSGGLFSGQVINPVTQELISFKGVVLQDYSLAAGCFPGWNESGEVWMEAE